MNFTLSDDDDGKGYQNEMSDSMESAENWIRPRGLHAWIVIWA